MLIVLSPAKTLDYETPPITEKFTMPELLPESEKLVGRLRKMSPAQLSRLMGISDDLAELNFQRYQQWQLPFTPENAKQAILAFHGDVYQGLDVSSLPVDTIEYSQKRVRILSGLYGVLRPLDLMQPYRLEMGTKIKYQRSANLYKFWNPAIRNKIQEAIAGSGSDVLLNLASGEYFKSIGASKLKTRIISPEFKDLKNGKYKIISFYAKKARGLMTRFILENRITDPEELQAFDMDGYHFNPQLSKADMPVFTREK